MPEKRPSVAQDSLLQDVSQTAAVGMLATVASELFTDKWWFDSVGFSRVFSTALVTKVVLFVMAAVITAGAVALSLYLAYRTRPLQIPMTPAQHVLEQYRQVDCRFWSLQQRWHLGPARRLFR